jgi:uncharacterized protein (TIGR03118 family)
MPSSCSRTGFVCLTAVATLFAGAGLVAGATPTAYVVTALTSNVSGTGTYTDANLVNAWGLVRGPSGPWWITANGSGATVVYDGTGNAGKTPLVIAVQPPKGSSGSSLPSGVVLNPTSDFQVTPGNPAVLIAVTAAGTINAYNQTVSTGHAYAKLDNSAKGASYTGAALGSLHGNNLLYVADFGCGCIDVFNKNFVSVTLPTGAFTDPMLPTGYSPFNIQNFGGLFFVTYAQKDSTTGMPVAGQGLGFVTAYMGDGTLVRRLQHGPWLNAPWGLAQAPATNFGSASGLILVGNFGSGNIIGFNPTTGAATAVLADSTSTPLVIDGLWGIGFGNDATAGPSTSLYFVSGPSGGTQGLFGTVTVAP